MKKKEKVNKEGRIVTKVVGTAAVSSVGIVRGKNIPVAIVESDNEGVIDHLISIHKSINSGECRSHWGLVDKKYVVLILNFSVPMEQELALLFDIVKQGIVVDQIMNTNCLHIMTGKSGDKLSENMDKPRILVEITSVGFEKIWEKTFCNEYSKHLKKKYHLSCKQAKEIFEEMRKQINTLQKDLQLKQ